MLPFSDFFAVIRWWAALLLVGTAVLPLTWTIFRSLPERGYAFTKMVGLLLVSYLFWLLGSLGVLRNDLGGIWVALGLATAVSWWAYTTQRRRDAAAPGLRAWLRANRGQVILTELLFLALFALWVWVRAQNPAILNTEKPMEFAFLNGIGRSATMPPLDPWLSGYAISYYYFGYVMTSLLARLAAVPEYIAFNLSIAWLVAGAGSGAFGLVYNLVAGINNRQDAESAKEEENAPASAHRLALLLGLVAALALPIVGNQQITLEMLHGNGAGTAAFWQWLDVRDINGVPQAETTPRYESSSWWWWRSSRVIHEHHLSGRSEEGLEPIVEFPGFSFVLGDMHPHVLALPFAFLSLAVAYVWFQQSGDLRFAIDDLRLTIDDWRAHQLLILFTAVVLGGLSFLNTWDVLIHLFVVLGAYVLARQRREGWRRELFAEAFWLALVLLLLFVALYLPFYLGFKSQAGAPFLLPMLMRPTRLSHFLIIFAMPLTGVVTLLLTLFARRRGRGWQRGLVTAVALFCALFLLMGLLGWVIASSADGWRVINLAQELGITLSPHPETAVAFGWGLRAVLALLPAILGARLAYPALTLFLLALVALVVALWQEDKEEAWNWKDAEQRVSPLPFALLLVFTGALLTLGPEFVYLRDNFGVRLNTMFKFYYQAWTLWGVAGLFALGYLWQRAKGSALVASVMYGAMFLLALLFPIYGVQSRAAEYRGPATAETRQPLTLDGLAYLLPYRAYEYEAIMWLRQNVAGAPVILEAVGGQYSDYGRIAASTGLPTVLGWAGHQYQWRGPDTPEPGARETAVKQIYTDPSWELTTLLLDQYNVAYIYVGEREMSAYGPQVHAKFGDLLEVAYSNDGVVIYRWQTK
ncbi:MAG: hypothetical protein IAE79_15080 [Anaerolinea sp.]|nr:hypothetical protein [Anaerolinea sp.]